MSVPTSIVFNQKGWECTWYSFMTALSKQVSLDWKKIESELNENPAGLLTPNKAKVFFESRGYWRIESVPRLKAKALLNRGIPLVMSSSGIDWETTAKPPYRAVWTNRIGSHRFCCVWYDRHTRLLKIQNTWWDRWGDNGCFYIHADDLDKCTGFYKITPWLKNPSS